MSTLTVTYKTASGATKTVTTQVADPAPAAPLKVVGMSADPTTWAQRLSEVGAAGVKARRIFINPLTSAGNDKASTINAAIAAGMMPVLSYKVSSVATLNSGGYDTWLDKLNTFLGGLGVTVTATFHHEPYNDMTPAEFRAGSQKFLDRLTAPNIKVGPILNGWLLDNRVTDFASFTSPALLAAWDFVGVDSYQDGTPDAPNVTNWGGRAVPKLAAWLDAQGFPDKPIGVGEYNGFTADSLRKGGEAILSTPEVWFGCVWNNEGGLGHVLTGDRLTAYQATKADPRAQQ